jgi:hypothetical protein
MIHARNSASASPAAELVAVVEPLVSRQSAARELHLDRLADFREVWPMMRRCCRGCYAK